MPIFGKDAPENADRPPKPKVLMLTNAPLVIGEEEEA